MQKGFAGGVRDFAKRLLSLNGSPHGIALGFALGLFLSVLPTFGLGMVAALVAAPFLRANLVSTYLGTLVVNPFTGVFFYGLDYFAGALLLGYGRDVAIPRSLDELFQAAGRVAVPLYVGGVIVAGVLSLAGYAVILWGAWAYRKKRGPSRTGSGEMRQEGEAGDNGIDSGSVQGN